MAVALKDCRIGIIVVENPERVREGKQPRIGHVVALGFNATGEVMPIVEWAHRYASPTSRTPERDLIHCSNLDLFTGDSFYEER